MPKVTTIPATRDRYTALPFNSLVRRRVAGYARVSTDSDEQFTSYEAQIDYYKNYILSHPEWEFVEVYTDEGISGLGTKKRDGFNRMIADALAGRIDLIVTKSVSRFARNTVDSLTTIRELKSHGVECFFEKENIYTFDSKGELLITIMSSLAQEESRSISENVTWGQRKRFADGKVSMPYKHFLGYNRGEDGTPVINEEEAKVVRLIYRLFLQGKTPAGIAKILDSRNIPTPGGGKKWRQTTIISILTNEKYKGDALLQKKFTVDYLTKKQKVNTGEVPQYYVENSHPAIIKPIEFDMVQAEMERRKTLGSRYSGAGVLASRIICGDCGGFYGHKVWHSTEAFKKDIWRCNKKFDREHKCTTPTMDELAIQNMFLKAYNALMGDREKLIEDCTLMLDTLAKGDDLEERIEALKDEIQEITDLVSKCVTENATTAQSQEEYSRKYNRLAQRYERKVAELEELQAEQMRRYSREREIRIFIEQIKDKPLLLEQWDEDLWIAIIESATVYSDGTMKFLFKNGAEITVEQ